MRYGVILAGGPGTRLWPASRRARPKPLMPTPGGGGESLLGATVRRAARVCDRIVVVADGDHASAVAAEVGPAAEILAEPVGRNTAAAIGLAAVHLAAGDPDAVVAVLPADHFIANEDGFRAAAARAFELAESRRTIAVVGVVPTRPDTGFGYLELGTEVSAVNADANADADADAEADDDDDDDDEADDDATRAWSVARFVEKPNPAEAETLCADGRHLWNAGMVFARADRLVADLDRYLPQTGRAMAEIGAALAAGGPRAASDAADRAYPTLAPVSFDHGVLEHSADLVAVADDFGWNDVGTWSAVAEVLSPDPDGNLRAGGGQMIAVAGARDNLIVADPGRLVAVVGVDDLVVVQSGDAVLVVPRARAQEVRDVVTALRRAGLDEFL